jgi:hypothetical protein
LSWRVLCGVRGLDIPSCCSAHIGTGSQTYENQRSKHGGGRRPAGCHQGLASRRGGRPGRGLETAGGVARTREAARGAPRPPVRGPTGAPGHCHLRWGGGARRAIRGKGGRARSLRRERVTLCIMQSMWGSEGERAGPMARGERRCGVRRARGQGNRRGDPRGACGGGCDACDCACRVPRPPAKPVDIDTVRSQSRRQTSNASILDRLGIGPTAHALNSDRWLLS